METEKSLEKRRGAELEPRRRTYTPPCDIYEDPEGLTVISDMPGVNADSLEVRIEKDVLTIRGRTRSMAPEKAEAYYTEFRQGDFYRAFSLGEEIDQASISATVKDGVLTLRLPKSEKAKPRKIEIRAK